MHPLFNLKNKLVEKSKNAELLMGIFQIQPGTMITEAVSTSQLQWVVLDGEAGPASRNDKIQFIQTLSGTPISSLIRIKNHSREEIEFCLDAGANGIMVPKVNNKSEAEQIAAAALYPPQGNRGVNPVRVSGYFNHSVDYFASANSNLYLLVQVETAEAVEKASEIAAVAGIAGLFIGAGDLSMSYNQPGVVTGEKMDAARKKVLEACSRTGKVAGIFAYSNELAAQYYEEGFKFIAIGNELKLLKTGISDGLKFLEK